MMVIQMLLLMNDEITSLRPVLPGKAQLQYSVEKDNTACWNGNST